MGRILGQAQQGEEETFQYANTLRICGFRSVNFSCTNTSVSSVVSNTASLLDERGHIVYLQSENNDMYVRTLGSINLI